MTANPKPSPEAVRRAEIKRRRETSIFWAAVHILGSLNVAVILLATIAGLIAFATVMESRFDTAVARYYIYDNPLFMLWLLVLALNLLCAALTRWPWQRKHLGFVVTHAGIILMLTGAVVGRAMGFEAFVTLDKTKPPESRLTTKDDILTIGGSDGVEWQYPFDVSMRPLTEARPFSLPLENSTLKLVIDRTTENLVPDDTLAASPDPGAPAGVALHFLNAGMGQDVPANLMLTGDAANFDFFGMAKVMMVDSLDETHPVAPAFHETQVVFANGLQKPVIDRDGDVQSGYTFTLEPAPGKKGTFQVTVQPAQGPGKSWPVAQLEKNWVSFYGDGDPVVFRVAKYWPDFAMKDNVPVSLSDQPLNPAVLIQVSGPLQSGWHDSNTATAAPPPLPQGLVMRVALAKEPGKIVYELERAGNIESRAIVPVGDTIHLGWSKWEARVDAAPAHAELHRDMKEFTGTVTPMMAASLRPGLHAHLAAPDGTSGPAEWIPAGTSRELFNGHDFARIGFGQRVIPLTFSITLENFEVPRDEGTDTPSNYISSLRFDEPSTGRIVHDTAHMNSPAMFPGDFWRSLLGWNYKFSQANWNPQNLNETTLQVLYDPGWPFKWVGSLGICSGIALMFYFMPKRSAVERSGREESEPEK
jgi:hypothetical protein